MRFKLQSIILVFLVNCLVRRNEVEGSAIRNGDSRFQNIELIENINGIVDSDSVFGELLNYVLMMFNLIKEDNAPTPTTPPCTTVQSTTALNHINTTTQIPIQSTSSTTTPVTTKMTDQPVETAKTLNDINATTVRSLVSVPSIILESLF